MKRHRIAALMFGLALMGVNVGCVATPDNAFKTYSRGDYLTAERRFQLLAAQGDAYASYMLAHMYDYYLGDYVRAHMWYNVVASSSAGEDNKRATTRRDFMAKFMTPAQIAEAQAMARRCEESNFKQCN